MATSSGNEAVVDDPARLRANIDDFIRDEKFWLDDGTIILVASGIGFRVYKGILASHSSVFRDMFTAGNADILADATCPVVHLSDSAEDLRPFLRAILPLEASFHLHERSSVQVSREEAIGVARLAHKYQADELQAQALTCLKSYYAPSHYSSWAKKGLQEDIHFLPSFRPDYAIGVVALARLTDTLEMLPLAFYDCARLGDNVREGWKRKDGTVETLSDADLQRCFDGAAAMRRRAAAAAAKVFAPTPRCDEGCTSQGRIHDMYDRVTEYGLLDEPLEPWASTIESAAQGVCETCMEQLLDRADMHRRELWWELPSFFGLEK
ncbi:uncharacterized protein TRAVEDRAFT_49766 [Trametes versicolor FP-101664 SS1]|uniref:uncharacterized protein n=1 Tax=Trametes versicolor (strain FP-101664) TaxID=717944 RepID=UPI0004621950|nr:uncharacterized protein TRAVEDRAFT_49766 [Trametes versicolor FP-101664 SS1]EIW56954.1 hypothetical protein TRAVEDRAFT_49766 [Trametes versicolor FP-101664 SS1]